MKNTLEQSSIGHKMGRETKFEKEIAICCAKNAGIDERQLIDHYHEIEKYLQEKSGGLSSITCSVLVKILIDAIKILKIDEKIKYLEQSIDAPENSLIGKPADAKLMKEELISLTDHYFRLFGIKFNETPITDGKYNHLIKILMDIPTIKSQLENFTIDISQWKNYRNNGGLEKFSLECREK